MLSPHEFATLLLVKDAPDQAEMERDELDALLEQQLVRLEALGSGRRYCVTESGDAALRSIKIRYS
ncbi:phage tail assembly chaperone [Burkholderia gladioli]|uniref:phage tail assembly chaperone n=1 Tax=Burkholderia gladioli TaxID=28095 RepID=UPI00163E82A5|nr:phage tail assembly chaperone [Burkholderia gladioli]